MLHNDEIRRQYARDERKLAAIYDLAGYRDIRFARIRRATVRAMVGFALLVGLVLGVSAFAGCGAATAATVAGAVRTGACIACEKMHDIGVCP